MRFCGNDNDDDDDGLYFNVYNILVSYPSLYVPYNIPIAMLPIEAKGFTNRIFRFENYETFFYQRWNKNVNEQHSVACG